MCVLDDVYISDRPWPTAIITNRLDENEPAMYQFDRFSLFLKCPFSRLFVVPFRVGKIFEASFCNNGILSYSGR